MENVPNSCVALVVLCCVDKRLLPSLFLDTLWCHVLCVCSQRCRFKCDGLHDISCLAQVTKVNRTVARIRHTFPKLGRCDTGHLVTW